RPADLRGRRADIWRYAEVLPVRRPDRRLTLGEGFTPLLGAPRLADALGLERLWIKDEGRNPTGSFKARGLAVAVARAWELGARDVADRKSTRLNSSHVKISYAVFCLKKKNELS